MTPTFQNPAQLNHSFGNVRNWGHFLILTVSAFVVPTNYYYYHYLILARVQIKLNE